MANNDFGARDIKFEDEEDEFGAIDINLSDDEDFGGMDIPEEDTSWGRFALRKGRGLAAGAGGLFGDIEEFVRADPLKLQNLFLNEEEAAKNPDISVEDKDRYLYNTRDIKNSIDEKSKEYGYDLKPRNFAERAEDKALEFLGAGGPIGLFSKGTKGLKAAAALPELFSSGAMGLTSQAAEEAELPAPLSFIATVLAGKKGKQVAPSTVKEGAKSLVQKGKNVIETVSHPVQTAKEVTAKGVAKLGKYKEEVVQAAERRGIKPTLSNVIESRPLQSAESFLKESALSGESYEKKLNEINTQTKDSFEKILNNVSTDVRAGRDIAEESIGKLKDNILESKDKYTKLYDKSKGAIPAGEKTTYKNTKSNIQGLKKSLEQTALNKGQRAETLKVINEIESNLDREARDFYIKERTDKIVDSHGKKVKPTPEQLKKIKIEADNAIKNGEGKVSPQILLGTEDSLNDFIDWHAQGGVKKTLKHVLQGNKSDIAEYGSKNKQFAKLNAEADKEFSNHAKTLRNDLVKSILKKEVPEEVLSKMNNVSNIRKVERALGQNPEGRKIVQGLKRAKLQELLDTKMLDNAGNVKYGTFATALKDPKKQELYKELLGNQNYRRIKDIEKVSSDLATTSSKFANTSKTATKAIDLGLAGTVLTQLFLALKSGGLGNIAISLGKFGLEASVMPLVSNLLTDDKFIDLVSKAAKNMKNPKAFKAYHDKMTDIVLKNIILQARLQEKEQKPQK